MGKDIKDYEFYYTQDGSIGLYSYEDEDVYHSKFGALSEAWEKFVLPSNISQKLQMKEKLAVLDVCYGIGYNTKALISNVINETENVLEINKKNKCFFSKIKKFFNKKNKKISKCTTYIDSKYTDNNPDFQKALNDKLSVYTESKEVNNESTCFYKLIEKNTNNFSCSSSNPIIKIDCLDINEKLVKISPLLKTLITPQEVFDKFVPNIFSCFESYHKIHIFLAKHGNYFAPKNNKKISELLDLKFSNNYLDIDSAYKVHKYANEILLNALLNKYDERYLSNNFKKFVSRRQINRFISSSIMNRAKFKCSFIYKTVKKLLKHPFLHNIYYRYISNRKEIGKKKLIFSLFDVNFYIKDARQSIQELNNTYDLVFLDAFTYSKAPELWSVEFIAELYKKLDDNGILLTYSNSALVRNTLLINNFYVGKIRDKNGKTIGTIASKEKSLIDYPLSNDEIGLCNTKAGIPYHDINLNKTKEYILKQREIEFKSSDLISSSQFYKIRKDKSNDIEKI